MTFVRMTLALSCLLAAACAPTLPRSDGFTLLPLDDLSAFRPAAANWRIAGGAAQDPADPRRLAASAGRGVLVNLPGEAARDNLFTRLEHGDAEWELDFMVPQGSNSGVYLQGRYEVQILDSWGVAAPTHTDVGGIYERWDEARPEGARGYEGYAPRVNAARAPGAWQHFRIVFQAPRFDAQGRKTADARFVRVELNGVLVQEDAPVTGPTRAAAFDDERAVGPLMLQGDHGPVAYRNVRFRPL